MPDVVLRSVETELSSEAVHIVFHCTLASVLALYLLVEAVNEADGIVPHVVIFGLRIGHIAGKHPLFVFRRAENVVGIEAHAQFLVEEILSQREIQHLYRFGELDCPVITRASATRPLTSSCPFAVKAIKRAAKNKNCFISILSSFLSYIFFISSNEGLRNVAKGGFATAIPVLQLYAIFPASLNHILQFYFFLHILSECIAD